MASIRTTLRAARERDARWVHALDVARSLCSAEGRARTWVQLVHRTVLHQPHGFTSLDRYPELFDLAAELKPAPERILSFGCATGEELESLRARFPRALLIGADINPRARRAAARRMAGDARARVVGPEAIEGRFDIIFALAVLQVEPHRIERHGIADLSLIYPFARFDATICELAGRLAPGGLLCVMHAQYRVEDSGAAPRLDAIKRSPALLAPLFGRDGRRLAPGAHASSIFRGKS